jgi:hypothetical membrane protein
MAINFINRGLLSLAFVTAFNQAIRSMEGSANRYRNGVLLMYVWGVGALLLAIFPTDAPNTSVSWHGLIHLVVATLAFIGAGLGALMISLRLRESGLSRRARRFSLSTSVLAILFLVFTLVSLQTGIGGLVERIFIGLVLLWISVMSVVFSRQMRVIAKPRI